jgi:hypothetical protein
MRMKDKTMASHIPGVQRIAPREIERCRQKVEASHELSRNLGLFRVRAPHGRSAIGHTCSCMYGHTPILGYNLSHTLFENKKRKLLQVSQQVVSLANTVLRGARDGEREGRSS